MLQSELFRCDTKVFFEFFKLAIAAGVKLTLGSDTHNLYEIGDFALHLDFLKRCGVDTNCEDVLLQLQ